MKSHKLVLDSSAKSANDAEPAFIAQPKDAPVYHGFPVLEDSLTNGWRYGAITEFEDVDKEEDEGDGFVIAPDGSRAGIVWSLDGPDFKEIVPPDKKRWGVYAVRFPKAVSSRKDLIDNFRTVLPLIKAQYQRVKEESNQCVKKEFSEKMKRTAVIRCLCLVIAPMLGSIPLMARFQRVIPLTFFLVACAIFIHAILSARDGVVLEWWSGVCERKKAPVGFWVAIGTHTFIGLGYLFLAIFAFFKPPQ